MFDEQTVIFGDSILRGVIWDEAAGRYRFSKSFDLSDVCPPLKVANKSKFGCTIDRGVQIVREMLARGEKIKYAVIEYGGNDADFDWARVSDAPDAPHLPKTEIARFRHLYEELIRLLKSAGITPIAVTLPPLDAEKYLSWITKEHLSREKILSFLGDTQRIYRFQEMYSDAVAQIASKFGCLMVDLRTSFLSSYHFNDIICIDGIHPNEKGQQLIKCELRRAFV